MKIVSNILFIKVFAFPPKLPGRPGPKVWNQQLLAFAGYTQPDGSILGDPANKDLTDSMISLGWKPPTIRTRWDLLPLVTVAEGDKPYMTHIPSELFPLVHITHPSEKFSLAFEKMGLRWVPAPALSGLGFDIGGMQYTAAPFIGWFMDSEIGVRDLADSFRYNALPLVAEAMDLIEDGQALDDLPQTKKMLVLSQAQSELNYAVNFSFAKAGVRMSDTLSAATMYSTFDDEHLEKYGFRLPADPYWLAPPQGSIVPIWHRGGAPNYQPKPMICRQSRCPVKAWKKEKQPANSAKRSTDSIEIDESTQRPIKLIKFVANGPVDSRPHIYTAYCSSGVTAPRLAEKLKSRLQILLNADNSKYSALMPSVPLNKLNLNILQPDDIVLIIASSAGRGDMPANGLAMLRNCSARRHLHGVRFAIFGNGNSSYGNNFNGSACKLESAMKSSGFESVMPLYKGDTLKEDPPWKQFSHWTSLIEKEIGLANAIQNDDLEQNVNSSFSNGSDLGDFVSQFFSSKVVSLDGVRNKSIRTVSVDINDKTYEEMQHVDVLVPLQDHELDDLLQRTNFTNEDACMVEGKAWQVRELLSLADLQKPFKNFDWAQSAGLHISAAVIMECANAPAFIAVKTLVSHAGSLRRINPVQFVQALTPLRPKTFSAASSPHKGEANILDLIVQKRDNGLFTDRFLSRARLGDKLYVRLRSSTGMSLSKINRPVIAFVTGSGVAPLRGLLQTYAVSAMTCSNDLKTSQLLSKVSVFAGFRPMDSDIIEECFREAAELGVIDLMRFVMSNKEKKRAQDELFRENCRDVIRSKIIDEGAHIFVCASKEAADDFARNLEAIVGVPSIRDALGEKWVEEVYIGANTGS